MNGNRIYQFTLIELLVVIAIIAVLASMLMPALSSARATAKKIDCAGREHQLGTVLQLYSNDYNGYVIPSRTATSCYNYWIWTLSPQYLETERYKTFSGSPYNDVTPIVCKTFSDGGQFWESTSSFGGLISTYSINGNFAASTYLTGWQGVLKRYDMIPKPASGSLVLEANVFSYNYFTYSSLLPLHSAMTMNVLFVDSHVESRRIPGGVPTDGDKYNDFWTGGIGSSIGY